MKRLIALTLLVFSTSIYAQEKELIDEFVKKIMAETKVVPGIGIAVISNGEPLLIQGYGFADRDLNISAKSNTPFYIASITKSFIGLLAAKMEEEGKIDLEAPLTSYKPFSEFEDKKLFQQFNLRQLLNHTHRLENKLLTHREAGTGQKSFEILKMLLEEKTTLREEGDDYEYSNLGYNIFGIMLKAEFGLDWRDELDRRIFEPVGMSRTSGYVSESVNNGWHMAWPHVANLSREASRSDLMKNDDMMQSAGGLICSPEDAGKWIQFFLAKGKLDKQRLFSKSLIEKSLKASVSFENEGRVFKNIGYGLGWNTAMLADQTINYHNGGFTGFFSHISVMMEHNLGVAVFANESYFGDNVSELIAAFAYDVMLGKVNDINAYDDRIEELNDFITAVHEKYNSHLEELADRKWLLELSKEEYAGVYFDKYGGEILVVYDKKNDLFKVSYGQLRAVATPYKKENIMRVDFTGQGLPFIFKIEDGAVTELNHYVLKTTFEKVK